MKKHYESTFIVANYIGIEMETEHLEQLEINNKFQRYRDHGQQSIKDLWDDDLNFAQNIRELIGQFTILPNAKLQLPIVSSLLIAPTPLCDRLPIGFCVGAAGSGKSTIGMIASELHNCPMLNSASSPASIRNEAMRLRYGDNGLNEKIYLLIWDDIKSDRFLECSVTYSIFRGGYDRKTDTITIAGQDGQNRVYRVFGGRLVSSIEPIYNHPKLTELQRRCLPIVCKQFKNFSQDEALDAGILDRNWQISDKLDPSEFSWRGIQAELFEYWQDDSRLMAFVGAKRKLQRSKRLKDLLGSSFTIAKDLIATAVAAELYVNLDDAVECFAEYWNAIALPSFSDLSAISKVIASKIDELTAPVRELNARAGYEALPYTINPAEIKARVELAARQGELDVYPSPKEIAAAMRQLGWNLEDLRPPSPITGIQWIRVSK